MDTARRTPRRDILLVGGLLLLHAVTALRYPWEDPQPLFAWLRPSADFVLLLAVGFAMALRFGARRWLTHPLALTFLFVPLFRFGATVFPVFYGKELDLYNDLLMAPGLAHLLLHRYAAWLQVVIAIAVVGVVIALYFGFHRVVRAVLRAGERRRWCLGVLGACQLVVLAGWVEVSVAPRAKGTVVAPGMLAPAVASTADAVQRWREASHYGEVLAEARARTATLPRALPGLEGADVYLLFIESYGMALHRKPATAERFRGWAAGWEESLHDQGFEVGSALCYPAISGGNSSLAHAQFLSGAEVGNRRQFDRLLASDLEGLPSFFTAAGYRTLNVQPATNAEWPESKFFGFQENVFLSAFPYEGRRYHWGYMPDQFALSHLWSTEVKDAEQPLFIQYISVTSHAPFNMIPPYMQDWEAAGRSETFAGEPLRSYPITWLNYSGHPDVEAAYMDVVHYSLETMVGFAGQLTRPSLLLILGDHQPPRVGDLKSYDGSYDVPIHVVANRKHLLAPFVGAGFTEGFVPAPNHPPYSTTLFLSIFLRMFGG